MRRRSPHWPGEPTSEHAIQAHINVPAPDQAVTSNAGLDDVRATEPVIRQATVSDTYILAAQARRAARRSPSRAARILGVVLPAVLLARIYAWLIASGNGEIWIAETPTARAAVLALRRGSLLEAVDFFSTGERLGLTLASALLKRADESRLTVALDTHGRAHRAYFRRLGFEPAGDHRMIRWPQPLPSAAPPQ